MITGLKDFLVLCLVLSKYKLKLSEVKLLYQLLETKLENNKYMEITPSEISIGKEAFISVVDNSSIPIEEKLYYKLSI